MAELARLPSFVGLPVYSGRELVQLQPGAKLVHVWVDGQRDFPDPNNFLVFDVRMLGGAGGPPSPTTASATPTAPASLEDDSGQLPTCPGATDCSRNVISHNLVEAYSSSHVVLPGEPGNDHPQADGIGVYCAHTVRSKGTTSSTSPTPPSCSSTARSFFTTSPPQVLAVVLAQHHRLGHRQLVLLLGIATDPSYSLGYGYRAGGATRPGRPAAASPTAPTPPASPTTSCGAATAPTSTSC